MPSAFSDRPMARLTLGGSVIESHTSYGSAIVCISCIAAAWQSKESTPFLQKSMLQRIYFLLHHFVFSSSISLYPILLWPLTVHSYNFWLSSPLEGKNFSPLFFGLVAQSFSRLCFPSQPNGDQLSFFNAPNQFRSIAWQVWNPFL